MPRRGGSEQRFCSPRHRQEFHVAARRWAEQAVAAGALTIADLQTGDAAECTLATDGKSSAMAAERVDKTVTAVLDALLDRIFGRLSDGELKALPDSVWALILHADSISRGAAGPPADC